MINQDVNVGMKRAESIDTLEAAKGTAHNRVCKAQSPKSIHTQTATCQM